MSELTQDQRNQSDLVSRLRQSVRSLYAEYVAISGVRRLFPEAWDEGAFAGTNSDLSPADIGEALAALDAMGSVIIDFSTGGNTEHGQALAKLARGS